MSRPPFTLDELGNTYVGPDDRFVVSLIVGYKPDRDNGIDTPEAALAAALDLTRDGCCGDTHWYVYDRQTKELHLIEQGQVEDVDVP